MEISVIFNPNTEMDDVQNLVDVLKKKVKPIVEFKPKTVEKDEDEETPKAKKGKKGKKAKAAEEDEGYDLDTVRNAVVAYAKREGKDDAVKLLKKFEAINDKGRPDVEEIDPDDYDEIMELMTEDSNDFDL